MISQEDLGFIGQVGYLRVKPGMYANVQIKEIRERYGGLDFLVAPMSGRGQSWVARDTVTMLLVNPKLS